MRKIINGRTYNTETSKAIGTYDNGYLLTDFQHCEETLYRNTRGAYFLHGQGGPMSKYAGPAPGGGTGGGEGIRPLTAEEARDWAEKHLDPTDYEAEFGEAEEAESGLVNRQRVNVVLANEVIAGLRKLSAETGVPMSRMVDKAILAMYGDRF